MAELHYVSVKSLCRICLIYNVKMIDMAAENLLKDYENLTGLKVNRSSHFASLLCYECHANLRKFRAFRDKCLRGCAVMYQSLFRLQSEVDVDEVQANRESFYLPSNLCFKKTIFTLQMFDGKTHHNSLPSNLNRRAIPVSDSTPFHSSSFHNHSKQSGLRDNLDPLSNMPDNADVKVEDDDNDSCDFHNSEDAITNDSLVDDLDPGGEILERGPDGEANLSEIRSTADSADISVNGRLRDRTNTKALDVVHFKAKGTPVVNRSTAIFHKAGNDLNSSACIYLPSDYEDPNRYSSGTACSLRRKDRDTSDTAVVPKIPKAIANSMDNDDEDDIKSAHSASSDFSPLKNSEYEISNSDGSSPSTNGISNRMGKSRKRLTTRDKRSKLSDAGNRNIQADSAEEDISRTSRELSVSGQLTLTIDKVDDNNDNKKEPKKLIYDRKNCCCFCQKLVTNFTRHLKRHHSQEIEVRNYYSIQDADPNERKKKRQAISELIRNRGNCLYNCRMINDENAKVIPNRRSPRGKCELPVKKFVICKDCLGTFNRSTFYKHWNTCTKNPDCNDLTVTYDEPASLPNVDGNKDNIDSNKKNKEIRKLFYNRKNCCCYCQKSVINFAGHLKTYHNQEIAVRKYYSMPIKTKKIDRHNKTPHKTLISIVGDKVITKMKRNDESEEMEKDSSEICDELINSRNEENDQSANASSKKSRTRWTVNEIDVVLKYFRSEIANKVNPGKAKCTKVIDSEPELSRRTWPQLNSFVNNVYTKKIGIPLTLRKEI